MDKIGISFILCSILAIAMLSFVDSSSSYGGLSEGDNTEGAIAVLEAASEEGIIPKEETERQSKMLRLATEIEKTRGMAKGKYIAPSYGDDKQNIAEILIEKLKNNEKVVIVLNAKKETSYLFADILSIPYKEINPENMPVIIANLNENIGLPRIRQHAVNIKKELKNKGVKFDIITGGLDEYPITGKEAVSALKDMDADFIIVAGVPHALPIEMLNIDTLAITDGPRLVEPLKELGYTYVVTELDAHSKTLGVDKIVASDFGEVIRKNVQKE